MSYSTWSLGLFLLHIVCLYKNKCMFLLHCLLRLLQGKYLLKWCTAHYHWTFWQHVHYIDKSRFTLGLSDGGTGLTNVNEAGYVANEIKWRRKDAAILFSGRSAVRVLDYRQKPLVWIAFPEKAWVVSF